MKGRHRFSFLSRFTQKARGHRLPAAHFLCLDISGGHGMEELMTLYLTDLIYHDGLWIMNGRARNA